MRRHGFRRELRQRQGVGDGREYAGQSRMFSENPDREYRDKLQNDQCRRIGDTRHEQDHQPAACVASDDAADQRQKRHRREGPDAGLTHSRNADGNPVDQERACIVQQALALEYFENAPRQFQMIKNCRRGRRVGRRDERAESNSAAHGRSGTKRRTTKATTMVVRPTAPITRDAIGNQYRFRSRRDVWYAASPRTGATRMASARSGSRVQSGAPGSATSAAPPIAKKVG